MKGVSRQQDNCSHVSLEQKLQRLKENVFPLMTESNNEKGMFIQNYFVFKIIYK